MKTRANVTLIIAAVCLLAAHEPVVGEPTPVVIADFETGVSAWQTNDGKVNGAAPSELCYIYAIAREEGDHTEQAAMFEFKQALNTWAGVRLQVSGITWLSNGAGQIAMWLRGDGSDHTVDLTLRAIIGEDRRDVSYVHRVSLESTHWQRRAIRLFAFKNREGQPIDAEALRGVYLIQFVQTGNWPAMTFCVDDIRAEPVPGVNLLVPPDRKPLAARVDFRELVGPMLAQVGANLGPEANPVLDSRSTAERAAQSLRGLAPCMVRVRLSDFYRAAAAEYDLIGLNRTINWISSAGGRPLICLDPGGGAGADEQFLTTAVKLVSLRRGGPRLRHYELFDSPLLTGQCATVEQLVAVYNDLARRVLAADPEARVGGPGLASAWDANVREFVQGAETLHFFSLKLHGAHTPAASPATLLDAAMAGVASDLPQQLSVAEVAALVADREPMPELFVTAFAPSSAVTGESEAFEGAWTAAALLSASPRADRLLHAALVGGMLGSNGRPLPTQRAAALIHKYAPRGAVLRQLSRPEPEVVTAAIWTATARNLIVVYAGEGPRTVAVDCAGVGSPLLVRGEQVMANGELRTGDRPNSPRQSIEFDGPGVAAVQFVTDM